MDGFHEELARRVAQFERYLRLMEERRRTVGKDCFIIFHERDQQSDKGAPSLKQERSRPRVLTAVVSENLEPSDFSGAGNHEDPDQDGGEDYGPGDNRFIQFSFWDQFFVMDMPFETLLEPEARRIQESRGGFFFVGERDNYPYYHKDVPEHNPFQKQFIYGDQNSAAADTAYVFFQVWNFPVAARLHVTASSFHTAHRWEQSVPLD